MHSFSLKALSFALSLILMLGLIPVFAVSAADGTTPADMTSLLTYGKEMRASFTSSSISVNGSTTEAGWSVITAIGENASAGAQWDASNLYLAVHNPKKSTVTVTLNGTALTKSNCTSKEAQNKQNVEYSIPLKTLGVSDHALGTTIPAKIQVGNDVWEGTIRLSAIEWFASDNNMKRFGTTAAGRTGLRLVHIASRPTGNQNVAAVSGGYNLFDKYSATTQNPISIHTYITYSGNTYAPFGDRTADTVVEFDFLAKSMPVYKLGTDDDFYSELSTCGFSWYMTDADDHFITMAIVNTDNGLVFVIHTMDNRDSGTSYSCVLNKKVGDKFRIGTSWTTDGDVILYVDGKILDVFEGAESSHLRVTGDNVLSFNIKRNAELPKSSADDFDIVITNLARGKYYGENLIDFVGFHTVQKDAAKNPDTNSITTDLSLPKSLKHPLLGDSVSLKWESSDSSVIDPATGKVTRPAENGKTVTLTATDSASGLKKSFDLYVTGLAPTSDVLVVEADQAAYKGKGVVADVPVFTLDTNNRSIIRDLKESKTVNVIVLKDSDGINKLSETMLTIYTSDDNKDYTQIPSFKMLRDGEYTYLYDFEATGRYIKVHCTTATTADCDFTAPLNEMINAYYEDIFGDGGSPFAAKSVVKIENNTDTAMFDTIHVLTPEEAGVKCAQDNCGDVRFYLGNELLYHYYDGTNFYVRVTKVPKNSSVTLYVFSGNASAKDISNKQNVYEIIYGTFETDGRGYARYACVLNNGTMISFSSSGNTGVPFDYRFSTDFGKSWGSGIIANGSTDYLCVVAGATVDRATNRIIVYGERKNPDTGYYESRFMYSDNMGRTWQKAPLDNNGHDYELIGSYTDPVVLSTYDGDGPNVDFVTVLNFYDKDMTEYYDNGYEHFVGVCTYSTDAGKSWTMSKDKIGYYDGIADGDHRHTREHGISELGINEAPNGDVVVYARCQYDNIYTLARSVSKDHGITWETHAELSDVYSTNTQPQIFDLNGQKLMMWAGNTMFGQASFRRYPLNVGISYDNLRTFEGIQDLYSKTQLQGMITTTRIDNTNSHLRISRDSALITNSSTDRQVHTLRIDNFTDYFYRTRGAYDSFEQTSAEWEGWAITGGEIGNSDAQASAGKYSMYFNPGSSAVRSVPYVQNGTVSFDLYIEDVDKAKLEFELESAFGTVYGDGAPIAFQLNGNKLTFAGASSAVTLDLKDGWNHFAFALDLANSTPAATLSVNGGEAIKVPVRTEIGNYVCYVHVICLGTLTYYMDEFLVIDNDNSFVPDTVVNAEASDLTEVPSVLKDLYDTADEMIAGMQAIALAGAAEGTEETGTALYSLTARISNDGGDTWRDATTLETPQRGMWMTVAYPEGTSAKDNDFKAYAVYEDNYKELAKSLRVIENADSLSVWVLDCNPVVISWEADTDPSSGNIFEGFDEIDPPSTTSAEEGSSLLLYAGIGTVAAALLAAVVIITTVTKKKA